MFIRICREILDILSHVIISGFAITWPIILILTVMEDKKNGKD